MKKTIKEYEEKLHEWVYEALNAVSSHVANRKEKTSSDDVAHSPMSGWLDGWDFGDKTLLFAGKLKLERIHIPRSRRGANCQEEYQRYRSAEIGRLGVGVWANVLGGESSAVMGVCVDHWFGPKNPGRSLCWHLGGRSLSLGSTKSFRVFKYNSIQYQPN